MPTVIKHARSTSELNDILELRYSVLTQAGRGSGQLSTFTKRIINHFDIYPSTINVIAYNNGKPIAALRSVEYLDSESILNLSFDYRETQKNLDSQLAFLDMLVLDQSFANHRILIRQLFKMILFLLARRGSKNAVYNAPEDYKDLFYQIGFLELSNSVFCPYLNFNITPMILDINKFNRTFFDNILDKEIIRFQEAFYYSIFEPGEVLALEGEKGTTAYLIESGEVEVLIQKNDQLISLSTITSGHLIGEVAMVTREPRTASLLAKTTTSCIAFDRSDFMRIMYSEPHRSLDLFKIFSKRLSESNKRLAELKGSP